jgi:hypothetical protein
LYGTFLALKWASLSWRILTSKKMTQTSDETLQSQNGTTNRLGFHYFPDTLHYSDRDLQIWLPLLKDLQVGWIVLRSETRRGIPEAFLAGLQKEQISPIIQFQASITQAPKSMKPIR